jgi:tetratricopeptide (TPR) repeat protein
MGIGKTRLLDWLGAEGEKEGFRVRRGSGLKGVTTPFGVFQQVFRGSPMGALASNGEPTMTVMLHYLSLLERDVTSTPLVVLVDDLQSADADSARLFQFLARNTKGMRVILVAALETEGDLPATVGAAAELPDILQSMDQEGLISTLRVEGLGREEIRQTAENFTAARFASSPLTEELFDVLERAGGNPYHVLATVRSLAEGGQLGLDQEGVRLGKIRTNRGMSGHSSLPVDARAAVERRMRLLSEDQRSLLQIGAVLGPQFPIEPVASALGKELADTVELAMGLTSEHRFLVPPIAKNELWSFSHPLTWHALLESQQPEVRADRALRLARWWAETRPKEVADVAQLFFLADDKSGGQVWAKRALEVAFERGSPELVERAFRWLHSFSSEQPIDERLEYGLGVYDRLVASKGVSAVALRILETLRDMGDRPPGLHLELVSRLARGVCGIRGPGEARKILSNSSASLSRLRGKNSARTRAQWQLASGLVSLWEGSYKRAERELRGAESGARRTGLLYERCYSLFLLGSALLEENRSSEARRTCAQLASVSASLEQSFGRLALYPLSLTARIAERDGAVLENIRLSESSQTIAWESDDVTNATISLANVAGACNEASRFDRAVEAGQEAEALAIRFRLTQIQAVVWHVRGETLVCIGAHEQGRTLLQSALEYFEKAGSTVKSLECRVSLARSLVTGGQAREGLDLLQSLAPLIRSMPQQLRPLYFMHLAAAHRQLDNKAAARADLRRAWALCSRFEDLLGQAKVTAEIARFEETYGTRVNAEKMWRKAQSLYRRCGISAPVRRVDPPPGPKLASGLPQIEGSLRVRGKSSVRSITDPGLRVEPGPALSPLVSVAREGEVGNAAPLGLSQRVVTHIALQARIREDELAPATITQSGISTALDRPQGVVAKVLHRLEAAGLARFDVRHVRGGSRRVKVYQLTPQGEALARELMPARRSATGPGRP